MPKEDAHWRVNEKSFIGHSLAQEGDVVVYNPPEGGEVAENLSPHNEVAQAIVDAQKSPHPHKRAAPEPEAVVEPKPKAPRTLKAKPSDTPAAGGEGQGADGEEDIG